MIANVFSFNSTTVQLILLLHPHRIVHILCFNSTTVQLILILKNLEVSYMSFQFHNGTINTWFGETETAGN